jgi:hypothetical protein
MMRSSLHEDELSIHLLCQVEGRGGGGGREVKLREERRKQPRGNGSESEGTKGKRNKKRDTEATHWKQKECYGETEAYALLTHPVTEY